MNLKRLSLVQLQFYQSVNCPIVSKIENQLGEKLSNLSGSR